MIGENTEKAILTAVDAEIKHCIEKHGEFNSHHEAWAVLSEEVEEVMECFGPFGSVVDGSMCDLWQLIRSDAMRTDDAKFAIEEVRKATLELVKEGIQVLAMCDKWDRLMIKVRHLQKNILQ